MKHSQLIGIIAALLIVIVCFFPWIYIPSLNIYLSGVNGKVSNDLTFGKQVIPHTFYAVLMILFFAIPKVWAKRANMFFGFFNMGWAIKNFIIFSFCRPECPIKQPALYILVASAVIMQLCALLPKMRLK